MKKIRNLLVLTLFSSVLASCAYLGTDRDQSVPVSEESSVDSTQVAAEQAAEESLADLPATAEEQVAGEPTVDSSTTAEEQVAEEPAVESPAAAEEQATEEPAVESPATTDEQVAEEPAVESPAAAEEQATEEPAVESPATTDEQVAEEPAVESPSTAEEQATEEPAIESPATTEELVAEEQPVAAESAGESTQEAEVPTVYEASTNGLYKPFVVASESTGTLAESTAATRSALEDAGFEIAGQYSPVDGANVIVVTNDVLQAVAARSERGGYAAGQRVSVTETDGNVEVTFVNPVYIQYAYRLKGDMQPVFNSLTNALGMVKTCGAGKKKMTAEKLGKYHYLMGMQYFDDPSELGSFDSHEAAVAAVENGLARDGDALTQVYRIDIPGTEQTVFGVGMKSNSKDTKDLDETFQMSVVDFEGCKKRAYFPYEVLVKGNDVEALHMRFRMAVHFPNLSMMGKHGFTKLISAPGEIERALEDMVNSE